MNLPFTTNEFLTVFAAYNRAIWPLQIVACGLGLVPVTAVLVPRYALMRLGFAVLAFLLAFTGIGYHLSFFSRINPLATAFAAFFVLQGLVFLASAMQSGDLRLPVIRTDEELMIARSGCRVLGLGVTGDE